MSVAPIFGQMTPRKAERVIRQSPVFNKPKTVDVTKLCQFRVTKYDLESCKTPLDCFLATASNDGARIAYSMGLITIKITALQVDRKYDWLPQPNYQAEVSLTEKGAKLASLYEGPRIVLIGCVPEWTFVAAWRELDEVTGITSASGAYGENSLLAEYTYHWENSEIGSRCKYRVPEHLRLCEEMLLKMY